MTQRIQAMLATHPQPHSPVDSGVLAECIAACMECAQVCTSCADACLGEQNHLMHLVKCIRLNLDCADICAATGSVLSRLTQSNPEVLKAQIAACLTACKACGDECEMHAREMNMQHCAVCAESCRRCEQACEQVLRGMNA
ncbi:four-helix bundle copper-binding protein [Deinococcus aquatilis]|uniref:four-helix bundle copper-binding protein n=1 Tax=Deinococcus aquatilis TaxID=519440 RepID=UPI000377C2F7|nr:four-helix bundle copper-binding protein [Deinococcus aquatilis]